LNKETTFFTPHNTKPLAHLAEGLFAFRMMWRASDPCLPMPTGVRRCRNR